MVLLTATPQILSAISSLPPPNISSLSDADGSLPSKPGDPISHNTLIILSRLLQTTSSKPTLNNLLRNARPYSPAPPPTPQKSPQYIALMARLRAEQEQREYHAMLSKSTIQSGSKSQFQLSAQEAGEEKDDITPSLVVNILLSVIMCGAAIFYMTRYWNNDGVRVLVSLAVAIVVGVAEVVVYAGYLRKVKESREKEAGVREKKIVMESEEIGTRRRDTEEKEEGDEVEREEIWGRGVNGGMRRRVREKWEKEREETDAE